jgi:hypothetical protein
VVPGIRSPAATLRASTPPQLNWDYPPRIIERHYTKRQWLRNGAIGGPAAGDFLDMTDSIGSSRGATGKARPGVHWWICGYSCGAGLGCGHQSGPVIPSRAEDD